MKRCPKCNCGAEFTNKTEYYASHAGGAALGIEAGLVASAFHPNRGGHVAHMVHHNVTQNVKKHYECTNSQCGYDWYE